MHRCKQRAPRPVAPRHWPGLSAQRAVDARANIGCAWPAWLNSDLDERARAAVKPVGVQSRRGLRPLGEKGFKTLSTSIDDAGARLSVSVLLGPWVVAAGPAVRVRLVSSLLLVGATPFLLHLIERISFYPRSWVRNMLRGGHGGGAQDAEEAKA